MDGDEVKLNPQPLPPMPPELIELFDRAELAKYVTDEELGEFDRATAAGKEGN
jgi:succinate dehydrogenase / fumarate reductase flavoprotein subunit